MTSRIAPIANNGNDLSENTDSGHILHSAQLGHKWSEVGADNSVVK